MLVTKLASMCILLMKLNFSFQLKILFTKLNSATEYKELHDDIKYYKELTNSVYRVFFQTKTTNSHLEFNLKMMRYFYIFNP